MPGKPTFPMKTIFALCSLLCVLAGPVLAAEKSDKQAQSNRRFKVIQTVNPSYPARMLNDGVSNGVVKAVLHIDSEGKLVDSLLVAYTREAFADEVMRVVKKWRFEPEYANGEPVDTVLELTFNFEVNGVLLVQRFGCDIASIDMLQGYQYKVCSLKNLDRIPTPVNIVQPTYPKEWADQGIVGKVAIDFYIDETGKVRLPSAPANAHPQLAGIAVAAVGKWQFVPPTRKGQPVLVHAQQIFDFRKMETPAQP